MKTILPLSIETVQDAKSFLSELIKNGEAFHPEDDAHEILWNLPKDQTPTVIQCNRLNKLMEDIYKLRDFDPCEFIVNETGGFAN